MKHLLDKEICLKSGPPGSGYILSVPSLSIISLIWKLGKSISSLEGFGLLSFFCPKFTGPVIHFAILVSFLHSETSIAIYSIG